MANTTYGDMKEASHQWLANLRSTYAEDPEFRAAIDVHNEAFKRYPEEANEWSKEALASWLVNRDRRE
jgi:hypothetical protein